MARREAWEKEVPELTREQQKVQDKILRDLGRNRENYVGTNYIDTSYSVGAWLRDSIRWELDTHPIGDSADSGDSSDL